MKPPYERPQITKVWLDDRPAPMWIAWVLVLVAAALLGFVAGLQI